MTRQSKKTKTADESNENWTRPVSMRANPELLARLEAIAQVDRRKLGSIVKMLVENGIDQMERDLGIKKK